MNDFLRLSMKAEVARNYSNQANSLNRRMQKIYEIIRKSAENGLFFVILENLTEDCLEDLKRSGYEIYSDNKGNFTIEW